MINSFIIYACILLITISLSNPTKKSTSPQIINGDSISCRIKRLALIGASPILPGCRLGDVESCEEQRYGVYEGLNLKTLCGDDEPIGGNIWIGDENLTPLPSYNVHFYVNQLTGSDSNNGNSKATAFQTFEKALTSSRLIPAPRIITLVGDYFLTETITLTSADSGLFLTGDSPTLSSPRPRLAATIKLNSNLCPWTSIEGGKIRCQLDPSVLDKVDTLSYLYVNGHQETRARYPNTQSTYEQLFTGNKPKWTSKPIGPLDHSISRKIIPTDFPQNRYNPGPRYDTFLLGYLSNTSTNTFDPPVSYFFHPRNTAQGTCRYSIPSGMTLKRNPIPLIADVSTGLFHAKHLFGWGSWIFWAKSINRNTITFGNGGWQEARGDCQKGGSDWWVENFLELFDFPGEFFLDKKNGYLYYYPPNEESNPLLNENVDIEIGTTLRRSIQILGELDKKVTDISITNIEFFSAYPTSMDKFEVPSGGDWSIHRGGVLHVENVDNFLLEHCKFIWSGGNALFLTKRSQNSLIRLNEFHGLGASAIIIVGNPDFYSLEPWIIKEYPENISVIGNVASHVGLHLLQSGPVLISLAKSITISGNVFYYGPRAGITLNDQFGQGHVMEKNVMFEMVRGTSDHGPFILWNRQPYEEPSKLPDILDNNFFLGREGQWDGKGINIDDGGFNIVVSNNIIVWGTQKVKGSLNDIFSNVNIFPKWKACVVFSYFTRYPAKNRYYNNNCIGNLAAYSFAVANTKGICETENFVAMNNTFFNSAKSTGLGGCAGNWNSWTKKGQDKGSGYLKGVPSDTEIVQVIYRKLSWLPKVLFAPTSSPTTSRPTSSPTTSTPSHAPSKSPSTSTPSRQPSKSPTVSSPSVSPTHSTPSVSPSHVPTTSNPTRSPSTSIPTDSPSRPPTRSPTTSIPSKRPSFSPTVHPSKSPTRSPKTGSPSHRPSDSPTKSTPTKSPRRASPTDSPTRGPTSLGGAD